MGEETTAERFRKLRKLARYTRLPEVEEEGRDQLIRFLDAYSPTEDTQSIVDSLCVHFGLYPYVSPGRALLSTAEALAYEFHRPAVSVRDESFVFHSDQAAIFHKLVDGRNVILSAPTSFGKSAILDALVATRKWNNIVVIVPSVALIDEVRRRLVRFTEHYDLITHPSQVPGENNLYVLTQERFLELSTAPRVDLFMIDEFYKLGKDDAGDQRMSMLNIAWNRLRATGAQYYLTGPNVDSLAEALSGDLRESLHVSGYRTVAVDVEDRSHITDDYRMEDIAHYWPTLEGTTLLFVSAPARAERTAVEASRLDGTKPPGRRALLVADWLAESFHPKWRIVDALRGGVGTHTGPLPRSLQRIMIRLFEERAIGALICTTTLIEGVNASAKNVIIFDKKIDRKVIDFFTFSNVRGRAGRMANHYVGRVITYMPPPAQEVMEVDIPIDSQPANAPMSSIVQLSDADLKDVSRTRLSGVLQQSEISLETLRANRGFDPELQISAARALRSDSTLRSFFGWSGMPSNNDARKVIEFGFLNLLSPRQRRGMNIGRLWGMLSSVRESRGDLQDLVRRQMPYRFSTEDESDVVAGVLAFQRNWMGYTIPSLLRATQRIYNEVALSLGQKGGNYEYYLSQVENLFLSPGLLDLDEYGLPLPIALKFRGLGMVGRDAVEVLQTFAALAQQDDIRSAFSEIELWIIDDVLEGLGQTPS